MRSPGRQGWELLVVCCDSECHQRAENDNCNSNLLILAELDGHLIYYISRRIITRCQPTC